MMEEIMNGTKANDEAIEKEEKMNIEVPMEFNNEVESNDLENVKNINNTPMCCYYECIDGGFCSICERQCSGKITTFDEAAKVVDYSKMCFTINAEKKKDEHSIPAETPHVFYLSKSELDRMINSTGVAQIKLAIDKNRITNGKINIFIAITNDEEKEKIKKRREVK